MRQSKEDKARLAAQARARQLRVQAAQLNAQARSLSREAGSGLAESAAELAERANEIAERIRSSDAYGKAWERGGELAARGTQAALLARQRLTDSDLAQIVRDSDAVAEARQRSKAVTGSALAGLGTWLSSGPVGERLGVQPRRRRWPALLVGVAGVAAGYAAGVLTAPKRGDEIRDEWATASSAGSATTQRIPPAEGLGQDTSGLSVPPSEKPLADKVRTVLGEDPRTSGLPKLNINVVEGTVFVRGSLPDDVDTDVVRQVIAGVEGVEDVDLQVTKS